ncbi:HEAT repeat-containing PBS lyase [Leptolyngbya boryana NIES-2135]|uniref:HEAT repeat-containing PBS lyase n=1 Tax=Leptolyngbya boryana NIES-2135 TaxID=1973484 RepID=A0A1Z4JE44_LEPBY|nr:MULTISPECIES: HEAT repeat domain-containing protein [Leptolyngbya]BAY54747.1 HEAT repeat-containing PBS lyase [Leptolyngbya boryana NIES-2135]MBD2365731.1 HEAT repeat domain-containing protein [Leptolyngbya sp. FACHB-161]MBD2371911.1 HEAT repeat domain-containing protein [Leptolyngbya sp. FACHB-238]MBD2396336.1 HEAT repeat domain-containing protein [Leptolyngbya sp. FACHB-239]MBD2402858.1 HEAT repeat domain-containing protein [Leptolyngbya sp. FACHB-402]
MHRKIDRFLSRFRFHVHRSAPLICLLALLFSLSSWVAVGTATEKPKEKLKEWHINGILAALEDSYPGVKEKAFEAFSGLNAENLKLFPKQSEEIRKRAIDIFKNGKEDPDVRGNAAEALGSAGKTNDTAVQVLTDVLKNSEERFLIRSAAAEALGNAGKTNDTAVQVLTDVFKNRKEDSDVRGCVAEALVNAGKADDTVVQFLVDILGNSEENFLIRSRAAEALVNAGKADDTVVQFLTDILRNSEANFLIRSNAARGLGNVGKTNNTAVQVFTDFLKNGKEDILIRINAVEGLGNAGKTNNTAVQVLTDILKNGKEDSLIRRPVAKALINAGKTNDTVAQVLTDILKNSKEDSKIRIGAASALIDAGKSEELAVQVLTDIFKNSKEDSKIRIDAVLALGNAGKTNSTVVQVLTDILKNSKEDSDLRIGAAWALIDAGKSEELAEQVLTDILKNSKEDSDLRIGAVLGLRKLRPLALSEIFVFIEQTHDRHSRDFDKARFAAYFYSGDSSVTKTLLKWIGSPKRDSIPTKLDHDEAKKTMEVFATAWKPSEGFTESRAELARAIATVISQGNWNLRDALLLEQHYKNLKDANFTEANTVKTAIDSLTLWKYLNQARNIIAAHLLFWAALIFAYPKYTWVQAIFFWNPWVRKIGGVGYVGFLLAWVPFLRRKLFEPFKVSLLADARLSNFDPKAYFPESNVNLVGSRHSAPLNKAIPRIQGQIILEGSSGLGKSLFLRHLAQQSDRIVVFLPARKCENGVIEAIQAKLHGQAQDAEFLKNLIYSGAIDICIDGLNEVSADTRAKISQFVESYFKGNIILTTQPIEWIAPTTAKIYELQPLENTQIETFLLSRQAIVAPNNESDYIKSCREYLTQALDSQQFSEELAATQRILSNPMDLTIVAQMIALGKTPDLFGLQKQQYELMAEDYRDRWNQDFPLKKFSEALYQLRLNDEKAIPADEFLHELLSMEDEKYKMVISRQWKDPQGEAKQEWSCRHDKIMEFFIVQTFLGDTETAQNRLIDHMGDSRFRGVYFLLATLLPLEEAADLREKLILYAAQSKDHTVSDIFVQLFYTRATLTAAAATST